MRFQRPLGIAPAPVKGRDLRHVVGQPGKGIEQRAVGIGIHQRPIVMLAVDFDQQLAGLAHQLHAHRLVIDRRFGTAVSRLRAAENQLAVIIKAILAQKQAGRMAASHIENRRHLALVQTMTHKPAIAAPAQRQRQTVEQNGFPRPGLARQNRQAAFEAEVQPLDQNDIADRQLAKHGVPIRRR